MENIHTASQQLLYTEAQISGNDSRKVAYEKLVIYVFTISSKMIRLLMSAFIIHLHFHAYNYQQQRPEYEFEFDIA